MSQTQDTAAPAPNHRGNLLRGLFVIVVLLLAALALWYFMFGRWFEETDDAYVQGNQVQITPLVAGTVVAINADDGMRVERGQLLVQLDPSDTAVALQQAEANLAKTVRQTRGLYRSVEGAQADLNARQVTLKRVREDYARRKDLAPPAPSPTKNWPRPRRAGRGRSGRGRFARDRRAQPRAGRRHRDRHPAGRAGAPHSCARPSSTTPAPALSRRSPATSPVVRCRSASACSRAMP